MFSRLRQIATTTLWKYADDAPVGRLHRHYRIAKAVVYVWMTSGVLMMSTLAEFMFSSPGIWRDVAMIILLVSGGLAGLSMLPATLCVFWAGEIEKTLLARGYPPPGPKPIERQVGTAAMKICFWVAVLVLGVHLLK